MLSKYWLKNLAYQSLNYENNTIDDNEFNKKDLIIEFLDLFFKDILDYIKTLNTYLDFENYIQVFKSDKKINLDKYVFVLMYKGVQFVLDFSKNILKIYVYAIFGFEKKKSIINSYNLNYSKFGYIAWIDGKGLEMPSDLVIKKLFENILLKFDPYDFKLYV